MGVRVGKAMAHNTFVIYVGNMSIAEVVYAASRRQAEEYARRKFGPGAYVFENVQALDITY